MSDKPKEETVKSKKLQITYTMELIEKMEERAGMLGLTLSQYHTYVVATDIENNLLRQKWRTEKH